MLDDLPDDPKVLRLRAENIAENSEIRRIRVDLLKHLMTLNTGTIVFTATMLEKLHVRPSDKFLVIATFAALFFSLSACIGILTHVEESARTPRAWRITFGAAVVLFGMGIACLAGFAVPAIIGVSPSAS